MSDTKEARLRAFYGRMKTEDILKLLKNGNVSSTSAALAVLAQRGVSDPSQARRERNRDNSGVDVDGDVGLIDFLGNLGFDSGD